MPSHSSPSAARSERSRHSCRSLGSGLQRGCEHQRNGTRTVAEPRMSTGVAGEPPEGRTAELSTLARSSFEVTRHWIAVTASTRARRRRRSPLRTRSHRGGMLVGTSTATFYRSPPLGPPSVNTYAVEGLEGGDRDWTETKNVMGRRSGTVIRVKLCHCRGPSVERLHIRTREPASPSSRGSR